MLETLFSLGPITISTSGAFAGFSFLVFSFVLWQRLREDFEEEKILSLTILLALFFLLGARAFYILSHFSHFGFSFSWLFWRAFPGFSLVGGISASLVILYWWAKKSQWDFWQVADATTFSFSFSFFLLSLGIFISRPDRDSFLGLFFSLLFLGLVLLLTRSYRKFIWYKSGKPGFVATSSLSIFSLGALLLEFFIKNGVFFIWEKAGFILFAVAGFSLFYWRSERVLKEDLQGLKAVFSKIFKKEAKSEK